MDLVVTLAGKHWPAWKVSNGTMVDVRLFGPDNALTYLPDKLLSAGLSESLVKQAGDSEPQGFLLFP